jgi:hypothetical protein
MNIEPNLRNKIMIVINTIISIGLLILIVKCS